MTETDSQHAGATRRAKGLKIERIFTRQGTHPYDEVTWQRRDVIQQNWKTGETVFEQRGVEFPDFWSVNASTIVTTKYFRGAVGTDAREWSLRQLIDRVVRTYRASGEREGYFATPEDAEVFEHELTHMLLHQVFAFNSPVWFNVGTKSPQQVSACQPYDALVSTPDGLVPIGKLVADRAVGAKVYDAHGLTRIIAVKANGVKDVLRLHTKAGYALDVTADHLVWKSSDDRGSGRFVEAGTLQPGDKLQWHRRDAHGEAEIERREIAEAALAGWLQSDGFVGQYETGTNRSLTIEAMTVTPAELVWVTDAIDTVFPGAHRHERSVGTQDASIDRRRTRLYGRGLSEFVEHWGLRARGVEMEVPSELFTAPLPVVAAYLRSIFQAEGFVSARERSTVVEVDMVGETHIRGIQSLLLRFGIFARVGFKPDARPDRKGCWSLGIQNAGDRRIFADEIGFIDPKKAEKLERSLDLPARGAAPVKRLEIARTEQIGAMEVYDIQTESGEYLSGNIRVHNCFILAVDDSMDSILNWYKEEGFIFKGGSGAGLNLSRIRSSKELLSSGGTASGPVSFMRGADASAGTIKSGGATRRAAKMVVLDVDHPDIEEFVETKAHEEDKIRALRDAGFDMDLGGKDIHSVQYQNANNSVRVNDDFMRAVEEGAEFGLRARQTGEVIDTVDARELFAKMAQAAWACADPGIQYDDTINDWHTNPETGRITASNPCFPAEQRVVTDQGLIQIGELVRRAAGGEKFQIYTNDVTSQEAPAARVVATRPVRYMVTGTNEIVELRFSDGSRLRCTPNHRVWTANRGWVHAEQLTEADEVARSVAYSPRSMADASVPPNALRVARRATQVALPEKWDEDFGHILGWLVGEGCLTNDELTLVYGSEADRTDAMPKHAELLREWTGFDAEPSLQANGTLQLRSGKRAVVDFMAALGVRAVKSSLKKVPDSVFEAPEEAVLGFLRGLFDADGCVVDDEVKGARYVGLSSRSEELLLGVQELLATFGIAARIYKTGTKVESLRYARKDGAIASYGSDGSSHDLRITGRSLREFAALIGFSIDHKNDLLTHVIDYHAVYNAREPVRLTSRESQGFETTYNLTEPRNHSYIVSGVVVANCSEYMSLDNSSCNLASLNLLKFLKDDDSFDSELFARCVEMVITAMDISICFADFPTEKIAETTRDYRQLGIGYANLGALLMAMGLGYDSEGGRTLAAAITSLMTGTSYKRSAELAAVVGPYEGYARNADPHSRVMRKHAAANDAIRSVTPNDSDVQRAAAKAWDQVIKLGERFGYRNAQASVLAPTGTISFMMDTDTTGIEPDFSLVKFKKLVGGGSMQIVNQTIPRALNKLGYASETIEAVVEFIAAHGHVIDAPGLKREHYEVFDTAMGERAIAPMGHVRMMAATQPFISGAISKTVNLPETATVEEIEDVYLQGWRLGLKALAVYRDNCKVGQPLQDAKAKGADKAYSAEDPTALSGAQSGKVVERPVRKRLPKSRPSRTTSFTVGGAEGYMTAGSYPDDGLGEVFLKLGKQGSTLAGVMDAFSMAISISLQYGVPLETYVSKFTNMKFEPAGLTDDPDVRMSQSIMDYIFRRLALDYLPFDSRAALGIYTADERQRQLDTGSYEAASDMVEVPEAESLRSDLGTTTESSVAADASVAEDVSTEEAKVVAETARPAPTGARTTAELMEALSGREVDSPLCLTCGTKMRPAGSCYVCEGCGSTSGCS